MSSEMRELVKEMRAGTPCYVAKVRGGRCVNGAECLRCAERLDWADRLERALLARTEAGDEKVSGCEDCAHNGRYLCDTHGPQDASGDAVAELIAAADVLNTGAKHGLSTYPEDWKRLDAALNAMQAKEAK